MRTIKSLTIFILLLICSSNLFAQRLNSSEIGNKELIIPEKIKSTHNSKKSDVTSIYYDIYKGYINIILNESNEIIKITAPKDINSEVLIKNLGKGSVPCPNCLPYIENRQCVIQCIIDAIFGKED